MTSSRPFPQFTHGRLSDGCHTIIFRDFDGVGPITGDLTAECEFRVNGSNRPHEILGTKESWGLLPTLDGNMEYPVVYGFGLKCSETYVY